MNISRLRKNLDFLQTISKEFLFLKSAEFLPNNLLELQTQNENIKASSTNTFKNLYSLQNTNNTIELKRLNMFGQQYDKSISIYSPKYNYMFEIQKVPGKFGGDKKNTIMEIFNQDVLQQTMNLEDFHEQIFNDWTFGKVQWNALETKIMYVAKLKEPKKQSFWENQLEDKEIEDAYKTFQYNSDCGEGLSNVYDLGIFIYNLTEQSLERVLLPEEILPMHPQFADPEGEEIIFSGTQNEKPFKLGLYACMNRKCSIYHLQKGFKKEKVFPKKKEEEKEKEEKKEKDKKEEKMKIEELQVISTKEISMFPSVSPNLEQIAYYGAPQQKAHCFNFGLNLYNLKSKATKEIIPQIKQLDEKNLFAGIVGFSDTLTKFKWLNNSKHALINSYVNNQKHFYLVDMETSQYKLISPLTQNTNVYNSIINVNKINNDILFASTTFKNMIQLQLLTGLNLTENSLEKCTEKIQYHNLQYYQKESNFMKQIKAILSTTQQKTIKLENSQAHAMLYSIENYQTKYLEQVGLQQIEKNEVIEDCKKPLMILLHGGPHSDSGVFTLMRMMYLIKGYNVLVPNFSGTIGFGQDFIDQLLGKISELDFNEITELISLVIKQKLCDPEKCFTMGGSYGGYLTGLLAGKENLHGVKFRGGILMNPVLNIPYMTNSSDIIDWVYAECFNKFFENYKFTAEEYKKMYEQSPMNYPAKIPLLLLLGKVDRRVPYHQGLAYANQCKLNGCKIETFVYPESDHQLGDSLNTEYDVILKCLNFIEENLEEVKEEKK